MVIASKYTNVIDSPIGKLGILTAESKLVKIDFLLASSPLVDSKDPLSSRVVSSLEGYFSSSKEKFDLPFSLSGTLLQNRIWLLLKKIPVGETITYGKLAEKLQTSPRVVGNACRSNPLPIFIPCHRVVGAKDIGGFCGMVAGGKIKIKEWLLNHEKV